MGIWIRAIGAMLGIMFFSAGGGIIFANGLIYRDEAWIFIGAVLIACAAGVLLGMAKEEIERAERQEANKEPWWGFGLSPEERENRLAKAKEILANTTSSGEDAFIESRRALRGE